MNCQNWFFTLCVKVYIQTKNIVRIQRSTIEYMNIGIYMYIEQGVYNLRVYIYFSSSFWPFHNNTFMIYICACIWYIYIYIWNKRNKKRFSFMDLSWGTSMHVYAHLYMFPSCSTNRTHCTYLTLQWNAEYCVM